MERDSGNGCGRNSSSTDERATSRLLVRLGISANFFNYRHDRAVINGLAVAQVALVSVLWTM